MSNYRDTGVADLVDPLAGVPIFDPDWEAQAEQWCPGDDSELPSWWVPGCDPDGDSLADQGAIAPSEAEELAFTLARLDYASVTARAGVASQYRLIAHVVAGARVHTDVWVGADPTVDKAWSDARGRDIRVVRHERAEFAMRAAVADIATRLRIAENTVRARAVYADTLMRRCPTVWDQFLDGRVSEANAMTTAQLAATLPEDSPVTWAAFDRAVSGIVGRLTSGAFRTRAHKVRERVHPETIEARAERSAEDRCVWVTPALDGMATLGAYIPATHAHAILGTLTRAARHLAEQPLESRTTTQIQADVFTDLLIPGPVPTHSGRSACGEFATDKSEPDGQTPVGDIDRNLEGSISGCRGGGYRGVCGGCRDDLEATSRRGIRATVAVTVPVMTLLGHGNEPAVLEGYGPIDIATARELAAGASSWVRILTHPVTGTVLDMDRTTYRVPADLRRWLAQRHPECIFPGCSRPAQDCDIDHIIDWQHGGSTRSDNLAPECRAHHRLKHETQWRVHRKPEPDPENFSDTGDSCRTGDYVWTSPTGNNVDPDPPPF